MIVEHDKRSSWEELSSFVETSDSSLYLEYLRDYFPGFTACKVALLKAAWEGQDEGEVFVERDASGLAVAATFQGSPWDYDVFHLKIGRIGAVFFSSVQGLSMESRVEVLSAILDYAKSRGYAQVQMRVRAADLPTLHAAEDLGFRLYDALDIFARDLTTLPPFKLRPVAGVQFCDISGADERLVCQMAREAFSSTRYFRDPRFPPERAGYLYEKLARDLLARDSPFVGAVDSQGFLGFALGAQDEGLSRSLDASFGYLWLIAVAQRARGKGLGATLLQRFIEGVRPQMRFLEIGTQVDNCPAINLYQRLGIRKQAALFTLHRWLIDNP